MTLKSSFLAKAAAIAALTLASLGSASAAVETYTIDPVHSSVGFTIRHVIGKVSGSFTEFNGTVVVDRANLENSTVSATIAATSVSTANEKRDTHLRSPDFFDVAKFPTLTFKSTSWKKTGDASFDVAGDLTIKGVTKSVVLKVTSSGFAIGMMGKPISAWEGTIVLNRRDFGVNGPAMLGHAVGDEVTVTLEIEADLAQ